MRTISVFSLMILLVVLAFTSVEGVTAQDADMAHIRFSNYADGMPALDIYVDGELTAVTGLEVSATSDWIEVPVGSHKFAAANTGGDPQFNILTNLPAGSWSTVVAFVNATSGRVSLKKISNNPHVRIAHFAAGMSAVDVYVDGELSAIQGLEYGLVTDWIELPVDNHRFSIGAAGKDPTLNLLSNLQAGTWTTIVAVGTPNAKKVNLKKITEEFAPLPTGTASITAFNGIPGTLPVNVVANANTLIQSLAFPGTLGNNDGADTIKVTASTYDVAVVASNDPAAVFVDLPDTLLTEGRNYFIGAFGLPQNPTFAIKMTEINDVFDF